MNRAQHGGIKRTKTAVHMPPAEATNLATVLADRVNGSVKKLSVSG